MPKRKPKTSASRVTDEFERIVKSAGSQRYVLRLYITGITAKSTQAISNIRALCEEYLPGRYDLEVIDIYQDPKSAIGSDIIAAPTLVKQFPAPVRKMIGDLTDRKRIILGLDLKISDQSGSKNKSDPIKWVEL